jgi:hypothetical protein
MKNRLTKILLLLLVQTPVHVAAGGDDDVSPEASPAINQEPEYISQSDVTREDYNTMSIFGDAYDVCLHETSRAEIPNYNDPRHVVDVAMKKCAVKLEELNEWLTEKRFPPSFKQRHIRKLSSSSVGDVMPQVMFMMSTKQQ